MKQISIKTVDGARFDLPPSDDGIAIVRRRGFEAPFVKLTAGNVTRYINCDHIVCITEKEE